MPALAQGYATLMFRVDAIIIGSTNIVVRIHRVSDQVVLLASISRRSVKRSSSRIVIHCLRSTGEAQTRTGEDMDDAVCVLDFVDCFFGVPPR